jgi:TrmH family RNA methyltransferase
VIEHISSLQNVKIKNIVKLQKASERKEQGLFIIEGEREINLALSSEIELHSFFICDEMGKKFPALPDSVFKYTLTKAVFEKIAYRENSDGCLALARMKSLSLADIKLRSTPFIIVLESVEKPGNLGAILRTADASQVDAVILCDPKTDIYNPNVVRSSVGCLFSNQVVAASSEEVLNWLKKQKINVYAAALTATKLYQHVDFTQPSAVVMGTEADGLSSFWLENAEQIKIAMRGKIDSLNVSTSCAVIVFEAMRQRVS